MTKLIILAKNPDIKIIQQNEERLRLTPLIITPNINDDLPYPQAPDDFFLSKSSVSRITSPKRAGWIYQQLLKYKAVLESDDEWVFILDGDTVVSDKSHLVENLILRTGKKIEKKYILFMKQLDIYDCISGFNFITNQMLFNRKYLLQMLREIENKFNCTWENAIIEILINNPRSEFSEYQLYAQWVIINIGAKIKKIKIFRRYDLVLFKQLDPFKKYSIISYEPHHPSGLLRRLRANLYFIFNLNLG